MTVDVQKFQGGRKWLTGGAAIGAVGLVATVVAMAGVLGGDAKALASMSYLIAFCYWAGISMTALILLMIFHTFHAKWMVVIRRPLEGMAAAIPVFVLLFIPIAAFGMNALYSWVHPHDHFHGHELLLVEKKHGYLNIPFFIIRTGIYLLVAILLSQRLFGLSLRQDETGDVRLTEKQRSLSAGGLPFIAITFSFAAFDWMMSLNPLWFSTIFGVYYFAGSFLSTLCILVLLVARARGRDEFGRFVSEEHSHNLGKLMLGFTAFWAYIAFSQFLLIWIANLPEETPFFLTRMNEGWRNVSIALLVLHFVIPFFTLLSRKLKRIPGKLAIVAVWQLAMHFLDLYWLIVPSLHPQGPKFHWSLVTAFVGVGLLSIAFAMWRIRGRFNIPVKDPYLAVSLRYRQP